MGYGTLNNSDMCELKEFQAKCNRESGKANAESDNKKDEIGAANNYPCQ
jgi:hypothetical protein